MREATLQDYTERMLRVLVHIQQNLDGDLSLESLAAVAHFSRYHFHRLFRGMTGEPLHGYVRRIRLERAACRLRQTDDSVIQVALAAGFQTHEAFTRAFRNQFSLAPSIYRTRNHRPAETGAPSGAHWREDGSPPQFEPVETGGATMEVNVRTLPPQRVAFMRHVGPYNEVGPTWSALCRSLGPKGALGPAATFIGLCHDDPEVTPPDKIRYDACVTVDERVGPTGELGVQILPGGDYAVTTHHGPYDNLAETYATLIGQWLPRHGRRMKHAPSLEYYLNSPETTEPAQLLTDVYVPLEHESGS